MKDRDIVKLSLPELIELIHRLMDEVETRAMELTE